MSKESAVDWYSKQHLKLLIQLEKKEITIGQYVTAHHEALEISKTLEREQIIKANYDGQDLHAKSVTKQMMVDNAESYYNETFHK